MKICPPPPRTHIEEDVRRALAEDIGTGDLSASIVPAEARARATVLCREEAVVCGLPWAEQCFRQLDRTAVLHRHFDDGAVLQPDSALCEVEGIARALLSAERTALNFLQHLSGLATRCRQFAQQTAGFDVLLLDTRKTVPGLRQAQKYAVRCGGCHNHREGLYDAWLLKENHIAAVGSIAEAVAAARRQDTGLPIEVEAENLEELTAIAEAGADIALLDNFSLADLRRAVAHMKGRIVLEYSGNVTEENLCAIAETGVERISIGALTKHCRAIDFSMRLV